MSEVWYLLNSGPGKPAANMAIDEALLERAAEYGAPVLRFYGWSEPAATFGYSQRYAEVASWTHLRPLIRRPTGGGLVPHDFDWTYSLVFPPGHAWYRFRAVESYRRVHEWVHAAFRRFQVETKLAPCASKDVPGRCFIGAEQFDVVQAGKKIAGAAQRRNRFGLLIQGSIQPNGIRIARADWETGMCEALVWSVPVSWQVLELDARLRMRVQELEAAKYSQASYNEGR